MKFVFVLLVIAYSTTLGSATLSALKPRSKTAAFLRPLMRYQTVRIAPPPPAVPVPVPVVYSAPVAPVSTFSSHVSTYSSATLPQPTYRIPIYTGPAVAYGGAPGFYEPATPTIVTYREIVPPFPDAIPLFEFPELKEYYSSYGELYRRKH